MPSQPLPFTSDPSGFFSLGSFFRRMILYLGWILASGLLFLHPLMAFISYSLSNENASHLVLIPFLSAWILFLERGRIFRALGSDVLAACSFLAAGAAVALLTFLAGTRLSPLNQLSLYILALLLLWVAGFSFFFG